ncbi:cyclic pyranopterin monophosphate synthase subunit MoaA [Rhodobacter aestuarii]|uniref:GTP 3',8-cyclase n=1 Tax=Rhodobacter aestuarii TaxID=453582 RepID=A0A1N7N9Q4_9RHOB|nr:GTP 3',8-cyclase MoaA [Rhodobacter aestuarii]PTV96324.1 cyclic pyranopterin monophosphate synthase subunit MoaA [Rhodobacter aestuarii]SIS95060.1 cyclic pyranopterin monophosphate synthase subunit MoaA [Rhodobacter aestuarii]
MTAPALTDAFARNITYLRVSVTDRCDFRCSYCMAEDTKFLPRRDVLSLEEIDRLASAFVGLGITKLRITGGEPLVRRDVMDLFRALSRHRVSGALKELTLTTNGAQLDRFAAPLADCGVERVNISLDSLSPERFAAITRRGDLGQVLAGIKAAKAAGLRVKINTVALQGVNEDELFDIVTWAGAEGLDLSFIEVMPLGEALGPERLGQFWALTDLRARLAERFTLDDLTETTGGPARYAKLRETGQKIGFITPLSHNFCAGCNRVRVSATGTLYPCLGQAGKVDLRGPLRASEGDGPLIEAIREGLAHKPKAHDFLYTETGVSGQVARQMNRTGG